MEFTPALIRRSLTANPVRPRRQHAGPGYKPDTRQVNRHLADRRKYDGWRIANPARTAVA